VPDFSQLAFTVNGSRFAIGEFINALLSFVILAAVVYFFVVLPVNTLMDRFKSDEPVGPKTRECPHCLSKIPAAASCCAFCTRDVTTTDTVAVRMTDSDRAISGA
jgi:large conductance mechanosensitive channel